MQLTKMCSITVVAEDSVAPSVCEKLSSLGASNYTVTQSGRYPSSASRKDVSESNLLRIEAIVREEAASEIIHALQDGSFTDDAVSFFISEVWASPQFVPGLSAPSSQYVSREVLWGEYLITL